MSNKTKQNIIFNSVASIFVSLFVLVLFFPLLESNAEDKAGKAESIKIFSKEDARNSDINEKLKINNIDSKLLAKLTDSNSTNYYIVSTPYSAKNGISYSELALYRYYENNPQKLWSFALYSDAEVAGCGDVERAKFTGIKSGLLKYEIEAFTPENYNVSTSTAVIKLNFMDCETRAVKENQLRFEVQKNYITVVE